MNKKEIISGWNPVKRLLSPVIAELPPLFWPRTKAKALIAEGKIERAKYLLACYPKSHRASIMMEALGERERERGSAADTVFS